MKKVLYALSLCLLLFICLTILLNVKVDIRQGINYRYHTIKLPLYLKVLDFYDRHFNYKELIRRIVKDSEDDTEKALKILKWTYANIKKAPENFPVIDDHVWHIIVRGYGVRDQFSDVFSTLCNYAGIDAFFSWVYTADGSKRIPMSFARLEDRWVVFDPYYGVYFKNKNGKTASVKLLNSKNSYSMEFLGEKPDMDYAPFLNNLAPIKDIGLTRANIQSPFNRLIFELNKLRGIFFKIRSAL